MIEGPVSGAMHGQGTIQLSHDSIKGRLVFLEDLRNHVIDLALPDQLGL